MFGFISIYTSSSSGMLAMTTVQAFDLWHMLLHMSTRLLFMPCHLHKTRKHGEPLPLVLVAKLAAISALLLLRP